MELDELRKKIQIDEKNTHDSMDIFRKNLKMKEVAKLKNKKNKLEYKIIKDFKKEINIEGYSNINKILLALVLFFKKNGILSSLFDFAYFHEKIVTDIQNILKLNRTDLKKNLKIRLIILMSFQFTVCLALALITKIILKTFIFLLK